MHCLLCGYVMFYTLQILGPDVCPGVRYRHGQLGGEGHHSSRHSQHHGNHPHGHGGTEGGEWQLKHQVNTAVLKIDS